MPENTIAYKGDLESGCLERSLLVSMCPNVNLEENAGTSPLFLVIIL